MLESLDDQLLRLSQEGRVDSEGRFTIDSQAAVRLFGHLALPEKSMYVLKLVQWAVASEATCINFEIGANRLCCSHNGRTTDPELFNQLINFNRPALNRAERHLQIACVCILSLKPADLVLESQQRRVSTRDGTAEYSGSDNRLTVIGAQVERFSRTARSLRSFGQFDLGTNTLGDLWSFLGRSEIALLRTHCEGGSVPIWLNGFCLNRPAQGLHNQSSKGEYTSLSRDATLPKSSFFLLNRNPAPFALAAPPLAWSSQNHWFNDNCNLVGTSSKSSTPLSFLEGFPKVALHWKGFPMMSCCLSSSVYPVPLKSVEDHVVYHFSDGVLVEKDTGPRLPGKLAVTFATCPDLKLDLSGLRVQRDEVWTAFNQRLIKFMDAAELT